MEEAEQREKMLLLATTDGEDDGATCEQAGGKSRFLCKTSRLGNKSHRFILCAGAFFVIAVVFLYNSDVEHASYNTLAGRSRFLIGDKEQKSSENGESSDGSHRQCRIPQMDPWDEAVKPFVKRPKPYSCPSPKPLSRLVYSTASPTMPPPTPSTTTSNTSTITNNTSKTTTIASTTTTNTSTATNNTSKTTKSPSTTTTSPSKATTNTSDASTSPSNTTTNTSTSTTSPSKATTNTSTSTTSPSKATTNTTNPPSETGHNASSSITFTATTKVSHSRIPPPLVALPQLKIEPSLKEKYGKEKDGELKCCTSTVTRGNVVSKKDLRADQSYRIGKCLSFNDTYQVDSDFTLIECTRGGKKVYTDMHSTVVPNAVTLKKIASASKEKTLPPSIMLLGLDSSSRLNIHRAAPKLMATLEELGAIEMAEYNKVGDNTLPNLLPILSGVSLPDANGRNNDTIKPNGFRCWLNKDYTFDECPFIWKNLSRKGYVTLMGEDEPNISIFNYHKPGFREQPTDHYLRPFYVVAEKRLKKTSRASATWCYANKATLTRVLEYAHSFVDTYERRAPFFSLLFITGIGHQNAADIELGDAELADFVRHVVTVSDAGLEEGGGGLFLAVFSDHGMRWGKLRQSPFGWFEERVPFLFIRPPLEAERARGKDARQAVRDSYPSLAENKNRLTSPFDFHFTLSALLNGKGSHPSGTSCPKCFDLLHEKVPTDRTCAEAGIPDKWCACADEEEISVEDKSTKQACLVAVKYLNSALKDAPQCASLKFGSALTARYRILPTINSKKRLRFLVVTFTTTPGEAVFEATLLTKDNGDFHVSSDLSRLNQYGNQSWCIDDADKKLYCYCL